VSNKRALRKKIADIREAGSYGKPEREEQERRERAMAYLDELAERRRLRTSQRVPERSPEEKLEHLSGDIAMLKQQASRMTGKEAQRAWRGVEYLEDLYRRRRGRLEAHRGEG
jgi:hypothetical protein